MPIDAELNYTHYEVAPSICAASMTVGLMRMRSASHLCTYLHHVHCMYQHQRAVCIPVYLSVFTLSCVSVFSVYLSVYPVFSVFQANCILCIPSLYTCIPGLYTLYTKSVYSVSLVCIPSLSSRRQQEATGGRRRQPEAEGDCRRQQEAAGGRRRQ